MAKTGIVEYTRQVRQEMKKVTWPTRRETVISTLSVFVMVLVMSIFMYTIDQIIAFVVRMIMGIGI